MAEIGHPMTEVGSLEGLNPRAQMRTHRIDPEGIVSYALRDEPKGKGVGPTEGSELRWLDSDFTSKKGKFHTKEQDRSLAPFDIKGFRNNQLTGNRRLPTPSITARGPIGTGMGAGILSLQRNIRGPSGSRRPTTIAASNILPLDNPRIQINRDKQLKTWAGDKNEHLWSAGDLSHDRLLSLLQPALRMPMEEMLGMEGVTVGRGPFGDALVFDDASGMPLPHISYSVFDLIDPAKQKGRWAPANRKFRAEDAGQDWRETLVGPSKVGGEVTGSIDPIMKIPELLDDGSVGYRKYTDDLGHTYEGIPVPMNIAPHEGELGLHRGIATGSKGIFFRPEDLTDAGRDVFDTARRGNVIQLSDDSFEDAWSLVKAVFPGRQDIWGDPGELFFWDERLGGSMPPARKYSEGGGGNKDIFDFVEANPGKLEELIGPKNDRFVPDYPLEGMEIPRFSGSKKEADQLALFGNPGKMPGISMLDMPMHTCHVTGSGACEACYAAQQNMAFNPAQQKYYRNKLASLEDLQGLMSAIQERMYDRAMKTADYSRSADPSKRGKGYIRHKASGDFGSAEEVSAVFDLLSQQTPEELRDLRHWISTRQYPYLMEAMEARGGPQEDFLPDNVNIRVSLPPNNTMPSKFSDLELNPAITTSGFIPKEFAVPADMIDICPATIHGNQQKCDEVMDPDTGMMGCRRCFRRGTPNVNYLEHGNRLTDILESHFSRFS